MTALKLKGFAGSILVLSATTIPVRAVAVPPDGAGFRAAQFLDLTINPSSIAVGDLTGDGLDDIVVSGERRMIGGGANLLQLFVQTSGGVAAPVELETSGDGGTDAGMAIGDLDGDGTPDLAMANRYGVDVFLQNGGTLGSPQLVAAPASDTVLIDDVVGDEGNDLIVSTYFRGIEVYDNVSGTWTRSAVVSPGALANEVAVGDVTGDGLNDIVAAVGGTVYVFARSSSGGFEGPQSIPVRSTVVFPQILDLAVGDVNGDGRGDLVAVVSGNRPVSALVVLAQQSNGTLVAEPSLPTADLPSSVAVSDLDHDGRNDVVVAHTSFGFISVFPGRAAGLGGEELIEASDNSFGPHGLAIGDVNNDGWGDIVTVGRQGRLTTIFGRQPGRPNTQLSTRPADWTRADPVDVTFSSNDPGATFVCSLRPVATESSCSSPLRFDGLPEGTYRLTVMAVDDEGNRDPTPSIDIFTIDRTDPETTVYGPSGSVTAPEVRFVLSGSEAGSFVECALDAAPWSTCDRVVDLTLSPGTHEFRARAVDPAGNADGTPDVRTLSYQPAPQLDLSLALVAPAASRRGTVITYTADATNGGTSSVDKLVVRLYLPTGASVTGRTLEGGSCRLMSNPTQVRCTRDRLAAGATARMTVRVRTQPGAPNPFWVTAKTSATPADGTPDDETRSAATRLT